MKLKTRIRALIRAKRAAQVRELKAECALYANRCQVLMNENYLLRARILELRGITGKERQGRDVRA